jgi:hypothetical protein
VIEKLEFKDNSNYVHRIKNKMIENFDYVCMNSTDEQEYHKYNKVVTL